VRVPLQELVDRGEWSFDVARMAETGDPASASLKTLEAEYTSGGTVRKVSGIDTQSDRYYYSGRPEEAVEVKIRADGRMWIEARQPGAYELRTAAGRIFRAEAPALPATLEVSGPWDVLSRLIAERHRWCGSTQLGSWSDNGTLESNIFLAAPPTPKSCDSRELHPPAANVYILIWAKSRSQPRLKLTDKIWEFW